MQASTTSTFKSASGPWHGTHGLSSRTLLVPAFSPALPTTDDLTLLTLNCVLLGAATAGSSCCLLRTCAKLEFPS